MTKISLILNVILIIAVGLLYYFHFEGKNENTESSEKVSKAIKALPDSTSIVYINTDTLLHKYKFYTELEQKLLAKQKSLENELNAKAIAFDKEAADFQRKVQNNSFLSQESASMQEQELMKKQQNLYQLREDLTKQLMEESQSLEKQLLDTVVNFLKHYNKTKNYKYILNSSSFLYSPDNYNITESIVTLLNNRYETKKK